MKVLVTGANGFVGRATCGQLVAHGHEVRRAVRRACEASGLDMPVTIGDIGPNTQWSAALDGIDAVVHLAARTHVMHDTAADPLAEYRRVNVEGTRHLAHAAAAAGVQRFMLLSSVKVNGKFGQRPFTETDPPAPEDAYGLSKWEAEQSLLRVARTSAMQWVILRCPLVYGPGVGANFLRLMRAVARGMPLPLGAIGNQRSLLYLGNLVDAIRVCLPHPRARDQLFLVSDGEDVSTTTLARRLAAALRVRPRLVPVPVRLLRLAGRLTGRTAAVARLVDSLRVDSSRMRTTLGWIPPFSVEQGLAETARWYLAQEQPG